MNNENYQIMKILVSFWLFDKSENSDFERKVLRILISTELYIKILIFDWISN